MRHALFPLALAACAGCASYALDLPMARFQEPPTGFGQEKPAAGAGIHGRAGGPPAPPMPGAPTDAAARQIVYAARLRIVVHSAEPALVEARAMAEEAGGYLQEQTRDRAVLRVPAALFRSVLDRLEGLGSVADREVRAEDVTEQHVDLQSRLRNARAVEARLKELLAKAKDVKEALEVEAELKRLGEEIERMEGRLKLLDRLVAFSTIAVEFLGKAPVPEAIAPRVRLPFRWIGGLDLESLVEQASRHALRGAGAFQQGARP